MIKKFSVGFTPKHYLVEILFGLTALLGFYLIIAWSSYSPIDSTWSVSSYQTEIINKAGKFGAWMVDLFFVFFGYVGHLLPFLLLIAPIYFIRTKRVDSLTWTRFSLRMFGFIVLICGLTALASLSLNNTSYHLAGGVLGATIVKAFYPLLGKFGLLCFAFVFSVIGFIFCSGASLIRLLVRFYNWLTEKNEEKQPEIVENENIEEWIETEIDEERAMIHAQQELQPHVNNLDEKPSSINIVGLSSHQNVLMLPQDQLKPESFGQYAVDENNDLPEVRISSLEQDNMMPQDYQSPEFLDPARSSVVLSEEELSENENFAQVHIPEVSLTPVRPLSPIGEGTAEAHSAASNISEIDISTEFDTSELATQFAQQEAERERIRLEKAQVLGVADIPEPLINELANSTVSLQPQLDLAPEPEVENNNGLRTLPIDKVMELFGNNKTVVKPTTELPSLDLLDYRATRVQEATEQEIQETSQRIEQQLRNFNVKAVVKDVLVGPVVTRYELELQPGVKASKVTSIDTDLARALMFKSIRVAETIPGKPYIGIETPNALRQIVSLREVLDSDEFRYTKALLPMALGKDISGKPIIIDLAKTPHLLVAGSTGSGKSVGINTMILSLLYKVKPEQVKFIMIDPKVVELSVYNDIPHLLTEVVTDMKKAANALRWCVDEMERRYQLLAKLRVRNIEGFNERLDEYRAENLVVPDPLWRPGDSMDATAPILEKLSYIVLIVDEFADLMMVAGKQIEELIARLTQKARAVGIHVILATQRPSVDVITGLIKSNIPSRIAFTVVQRNDSRTILDQNGAEALLGRGDMLYLGNGTTDLIRVHGAYMSDDEVVRVADDWRARGKPNYISAILESSDEDSVDDELGGDGNPDELDDLFDEVVEFVSRTGTTSTSSIQRRFRVGFNRAARIMDQLEEQGIVSEMRNGKREILVRNNQEY
ncbi:FtsK/SpoIIIE family protein [Pasteurella bettyae CCUG 2042]|uniref:DNA translocase FtsK n=1 Tax=Pasteurella bettyae CCUG 2042 TaxID=1095749 RepID=I3DCG6_9PAST|nr:DNA translocase FtsK [Pasteurella bettyae]EIJ69409.1 FtsK/SpoIIIE family protein [Pasteurella bettyae CCUG 2042]